MNLGVLERMTPQVARATRHWSPVFGQRKADSGKIRMSTDPRELNSTREKPPGFKTDNWQTVEQCLALNPQLQWRAVVDLANFFPQRPAEG